MVMYGRCAAEPGDFGTASIRAARLIGDTADAPIHVLFSGGVDSEVAMLSFLSAKVPITAAIMRFKDDLNAHDIGFAIRFCERYHVPYRLYDLDILKFMDERLLDYTVPTRCNAPMMAATMWLVDQIDGYPVLGQGECLMLRPQRRRRLKHARIASYQDVIFDENRWALQESETCNGWYRHFLLRNRNGVPGFHQYTPEQILSYVRDPLVVKNLSAPDHASNEAWKLRMYQQYFPLAERPVYSGYEKVVEAIQRYRVGHTARFPFAHSFVLFDYDLLEGILAP